MGQENDKMILGNEEEQSEKNSRKGKIFQKNYTVKGESKDDICDVPNCNCPAYHENRSNVKMCTDCLSSGKNFRKTAQLPYEPKYKRRSPSRPIYSKSDYEQNPPVEQSYPVYYYNAWSLPLQKCFLERPQKHLSQTNISQVQSQYINKPPEQQPKPQKRVQIQPDRSEMERRPAREQASHVERYDFSNVPSENRMQNLFLYDKN